MTHPFAFPNENGFEDRNGNHVTSGDRCMNILNSRRMYLDEALHDGDAFVTYEDGTYGTEKWHNLIKIPVSKGG